MTFMRAVGERRRGPARRFSTTDRGGIVEIAPIGRFGRRRCRLGRDDAQRLGRLVCDLLDDDAPSIVVDLRHCTTTDTTVIAVLIDARRRAREADAALVVRGSASLQEIAEVYRVDGILSMT